MLAPLKLDSYSPTEQPFQQNFQYPPTVLNTVTGERISLVQLAKSCLSKSSKLKACQLTQPVKLFTRWDTDNYLTGEIGDWLGNYSDDDFCIITQTAFEKLYRPTLQRP